MEQKSLSVLIEAALFSVIAILLTLIPQTIGGSEIALGMIPMLFFTLRRGARAGLFGFILWSLLYFVIGRAVILTPVQGILEYPVAFGFAALAGVFQPQFKRAVVEGENQKALRWMLTAIVVGTVAKYFWHFIAGIYFWAQYAPEGVNPVVFSGITNGISFVLTTLVSSVILGFMYSRSKRIFVA